MRIVAIMLPSVTALPGAESTCEQGQMEQQVRRRHVLTRRASKSLRNNSCISQHNICFPAMDRLLHYARCKLEARSFS
jgi:hypothetical protein